MKKIYIFVSFFILFGCSSVGTTKVSYYNLENRSISNNENSLNVCSLSLTTSEHLKTNSIVYQIGDVEYILTSSNKWISSLPYMLLNSLKNEINLRQDLSVYTQESFKKCNENYINLHISEFKGTYKGKTEVTASWNVHNNGKICKNSKSYINDIKKDGYVGVVESLNESWNQVLKDSTNDFIKCI